MTDQDTISFYDQQTEAYKKVAESFDNVQLRSFTARLSPGAHVLDLGCGPGQDSRLMSRAGLTVTAMDASPEMIRQAATIDGVKTRLAAFSELDDVGEYDAVWASFSLLHAPKADFPEHLKAIQRALKPGGLFAISLKVGQGEKRDRLNRFYAFYEIPELQGLLQAAGFAILDTSQGSSKGMAGVPEPYVTMIARA